MRLPFIHGATNRLYYALLLCILHQARSIADNPVDACPHIEAKPVPNDIHHLRPSDVKVVAAIGDSITAGFAIEGLPVENKGESWAIGGGVGHVTLPNILKHYSPNITGASTGTHPMYSTAGFNMAITANNVSRLMAQSKKLVSALESSVQVNMKEDWKILTVFIGINDLRIGCQSKRDPLWTHQEDYYEKQLTAVLTFLRASIPRLFVNLVGLLHLSSINTASGIAEHCQLQHYATEFECPCCFHNASYMQDVRGKFNAKMQKIAAAWASQDLHDFAVVWQPMLTDYSIPDWTYMSRFDCFHYSKAWHADAAVTLWNQMLTPGDQKSTNMKTTPTLICPHDNSTFYVK